MISTDDQLSKAMLDGILMAFKTELKEHLQKEADSIIERTVTELSSRLEAKLESREDCVWGNKHIKLSWCLKREGVQVK